MYFCLSQTSPVSPTIQAHTRDDQNFLDWQSGNGETELFRPTGKTSKGHSFTRIHNCKDQSMELTKEAILVTQSSASSAKDKGLLPESELFLLVIRLKMAITHQDL